MRSRGVVLALAIIAAPLGAQAADLVVWWDEGYYPEENEAVRETIAAFEHDTGKQVELVFHPMEELPDQIWAALEAGHPPDFAFGFWLDGDAEQLAYEDRLVDLTDAIGHFSDLFDPGQLKRAVLLNGTTGEKALYGLPVGQITHLTHVWKSLLAQAGYTLEDIPREWDAYLVLLVRPGAAGACVRRPAAMTSGPWVCRCRSKRLIRQNRIRPVSDAYEADYVTPDGRLIIDEPEIRQRLIEAMDSYTAIQLKGCSPPDSLTWPDIGNNKAFLAQSVVMTPNLSLSIPNALKADRPDDYYENTATIEWPLGPSGEPFPIVAACPLRHGFQRRRPRRHGQGVRPLPRGRRLAHALSRLFGRAHVAVDRRSCSTSRSGSTRATRTRWPR